MSSFPNQTAIEVLALVTQLSPDIISIIDINGNILFNSVSAKRIHGYTDEEITHQNTFELIHPEDRNKFLEVIEELKKQPNKIFTVQYRYKNKDGSYQWMEATAINHLDNSWIKGLITVSRDISERKKFEQEILKNHLELKKFFDTFLDNYIRFHISGLILETSPKFSIKGFVPIPNKKLVDCIPILEYQKIKNEFKKNYVKNQIFSFEINYLNQNLEIKIIPIKDEEWICVIKDFTSNYHAIKSLETSEARYKSLFFNAPNGIAQLTQNFIFEQVNPALCKLLGYKPENIIGKSLFDFLQESKDEVFIQFINQFLSSHDPFEMDLPFLNAQNETLYINLKINTVSDSVGATKYLLAYFVDVTAIKQNQQIMQESLREKESLIKEIHHRVKNNLQVISSLLSLQMSFMKNTEIIEKFKITQARVHSIALLHDQLYKSNSLNQVIMSNYIQLLTNNLIQSSNIPIHLVKTNFFLENFVLDIEQASPIAIILNELISNALKHTYTDDKKNIEITISYENLQNQHLLKVKDNGQGLPSDFDIRKVKTLGLSLVNILTKQINGKLSCFNQNGANFELIF